MEQADKRNVVSVDYVNDITGDGTAEIACGSSTGMVYLLNGADGDEIWAKPTADGVPVHRVIGVLDITGDGVPDVVAGGRREDDHDVVQSFDGTDGSSPWDKNPYTYGDPCMHAGIYIFAVYYPGSERCEPTYSLTVLLIQ